MATNWDILKTRFLQAAPTEQLHSLALNLTRLQSLADSDADAEIAKHYLRESQFFIEWIVPTLDLTIDAELATQLVDLQRQLSRWKLDLSAHWSTEQARQQLAQTAWDWSQRLSPIATPLAS